MFKCSGADARMVSTLSDLHILRIIVSTKQECQLNMAAGRKVQPPAAVSIIRKGGDEQPSPQLRHYLHDY